MAKLIITGEGPNQRELEGLIGRHDVPGFVSGSLGLTWKSEIVKVLHATGNADWSGDVVRVDFSRGIWCVPGIAHELVHILLRQSGWPAADLLLLERRVPELSNERGTLYGIEQIIAYLVQADVARILAREEEKPELETAWKDSKFEHIVQTEYRTNIAREMVQRIIKAWSSRPRNENISVWLERILR